MTKRQGKSGTIDVKALLKDEEFLRALVRVALRAALCQMPGRDEGMVISDRTKG